MWTSADRLTSDNPGLATSETLAVALAEGRSIGLRSALKIESSERAATSQAQLVTRPLALAHRVLVILLACRTQKAA
jgi:hypothetical protein